MTKLQKYLLAFLGVQIVLILVVFLLQRPVTASDNLIFPDLKIENVSEVTISDSEGNTVTMQKNGDQWTLPLQDGFPVEEEKIQQLVDRLAQIRDNRLVTQSESSHGRLRISEDNFVSKVDITINGTQNTLYFGSSPATSNIHFRLAGRSEVYLTNAISTSHISPAIASWVDTLIYQISGDAVQKIEVTNSQGEFIFEADSEGVWSSEQIDEGDQFDQSKWSSLKTALTTLRFVEPVSKTLSPEFGLDDPDTIVVLSYSNDQGEILQGELWIGNADEQENYFVKWSDSEFIFKVAGFNASRLTGLSSEDFTSPIPTPTPKTTD